MLTDVVTRVTGCFRSRSSSPWDVQAVRQASELPRLRTVWDALLQQTPHATFFQTIDWLETYWRHAGPDQELILLVVAMRDGTPMGILPLCVKRERTRLGMVRRVGFPLDQWGTQYRPLGSRPAETLAAGLQYLRETRQEWDVIDLRWLPATCRSDVEQAFGCSQLPYHASRWDRTEQVDLAAGWDDYWRSRSSKWRNNQRRSERRLQQRGQLRIEHFRPEPHSEDAADAWFTRCQQVAATSWQGACTSGNTLNHSEVSPLLRDLHRAAVRLGAVHVSLLSLDERPIAFTYNYLYRGLVCGLRMGYDLRFQTAGPGSVLLRETLRECCQRGDQLFDLGEGLSPYKKQFSNHAVETWRFCHFARFSPRAQLLRWKHHLRAAAMAPGNE
jgi:CelD/BcsL family acetyltransferase involved in cellulose biosynthesis